MMTSQSYTTTINLNHHIDTYTQPTSTGYLNKLVVSYENYNNHTS